MREARVLLTYEEAESIKREYGLPLSTEAGTTTKEGVPLDQIPRLLSPFLQKLLGEIKTSLDFYMTEFQIPVVEKIIMSGGTAGLKGLKEFLARDLGIEIELADPFQSASFSGKISNDDFLDGTSAFVMPLGLAAWEDGEMSFLRMEKAAAKKKRGLIVPLVAPSCVAALIMIILGWSVSAKLASSSRELEAKTKELTAVNPLSIATKALSAKKKKLQVELNAYPLSLLGQNMNPARILEDLRLCAPTNTRLEEIKVIEEEGKKYVEVSGTAFFLDERGPAMSDFMASLEDSQVFDDIRMVTVNEEGSYTVDGLRFKLRCQYNYNHL